MTTLTKKTKVIYTPAIVGSPGDPGSPPRPGYYTYAIPSGPYPKWYFLTPMGQEFYSYSETRPADITYGGNEWDGKAFTVAWYPARPPAVTMVWVPPSRGRPAVPPVKGSPAKTETTFNLGWNSGAISNETRDGDAILDLKASPSSVGIVVGLNQIYAKNDYKTFTHSFYFSNGKVVVYETGVQKTTPISFFAENEFQIRRVAGSVSYYKGSELLHTSATPSAGAVFADTSLYSAGDAITSAAFIAGDESNPSAEKDATSSASLQPITGLSSDHDYTEVKGRFLPLQSFAADSDQELRPDYTLVSGELLPLLGFSVIVMGKAAEVDAAFHPVAGLSSDAAYTESRGVFLPLETFAMQVPPLGSHAFLAPPLPTLRVTVTDSTGLNAAHVLAPMAKLTMHFGGFASLSAPTPTLAAAGTVENWLTANIAAPAGVLTANATTSEVCRASISAPMASLVGYGGMVCSVTLTGKPSIQSTVISGGVSSAAITAPTARLTLFELTAEVHCSAHILAPAGQTGNSLHAWIIAPAGKLTAIGTAVVAASYEAYSINLSHRDPEASDEVTRYTNFPFDRIVRYQGSYFGVAADGLYLLEGTTDDGQAIPYAIKTCIDDFKAPELKTVASAYFSGRLGPDATVTLHAGEQGQESYPYNTPRGQGAQNHREKFGRGVKNRYFAIGVAGDDAFELDAIELEVNKMSRRI